jgi:hypothetical protein
VLPGPMPERPLLGRRRTSRRVLVAVAGAAGLLLAGCGGGSGGAKPAASSAPPTNSAQGAGSPSSAPSSAPSSPAAGSASAGGPAVTLNSGATVFSFSTPAGWQVRRLKANSVRLSNGRGGFVFVTSGRGQTGNVATNLGDDIRTGGLSSTATFQPVHTYSGTGNLFQTGALRGFHDASVGQPYGIVAEYLDTHSSDHFGCFIDFYGNSRAAFAAALPDFEAIVKSIGDASPGG